MASKKSDEKPVVRCAVYTRKSTEEGLEKEFNTLDAQRESGEAYIASQKHEGWVCLPDRYDDGGFTGGNMDRPALQRLLSDIESGKVNCLVVYKLDRLSRSLMDFAKIVEILDRHQASFVSVTQQFNTKDSMGRLTLNILLSFAQFEREIISERTRDKIAAARRKGKWTGGTQILGYDVDFQTGKLVLNPLEADQVRQIFNLYLEHRSLREVVRELEERGWTSKTWTTKKGNLHQGLPFNKQRIHQLLRNVTYLGKIRYKEEIHEGEHQAIIDPDTWKEVQAQLKRGDRTPDQPRNKHKALLRGLLHCSVCDAPMIHLPVTKKGQKLFRYYVCMNAHDNGWDKCATPSIPAEEIEKFVVGRLLELGSDEQLLDEVLRQAALLRNEQFESMRRDLQRLQATQGTLQQFSDESHRRELRAIASQVRSLQSRMVEMQSRTISIADCEDAMGRFEELWRFLAIDEQTRLLKLIFERIDFDGTSGKITFRFQNTHLTIAEVA